MTGVTIVEASLAILATVLLAAMVARLLRSIVPLPVVQIGLGLALGLVADLRIRIEPETFLLLFLPPLLFLDAWRIPNRALGRDWAIVAELAFGLVLATVGGIGAFLHWLLPALPWPLCFALAAVLSPTDAVAVGSITRRVPMPERLRHLLAGEALLNDASALVCLRFAVAALATGSFSWTGAGVTFLWLAAGGLGIGAAFAWAAETGSTWVARRFDEQAGAHILLTLLLPFAAYLLAETVGASGILAAVAAGLLMTRFDRRIERATETRQRRRATWDMVGFALNGAVFVLLGEQLTLIVDLAERSAVVSGAGSLAMLGVDILLITLALLLLRAAWAWVSMRSRRALRLPSAPPQRSPWLLVLATTLGGVRGSVTLVAVLTIPRTLANGAAVPTAIVAVTIATGVILLSLGVASLALPPVLRRLDAS